MMRRVALFRDVYLPASQTFIHDEIRSHRRWQVEVFARRTVNRDRFPFEPVHVVRDPLFKLRAWDRSFDRMIGSGRFSLLHAHFGYDARFVLPYSRRHGVPLVVTFHGADVGIMTGRDWLRPRWWRYALSWRGLLRDTDLLLAASEDLRDRLVDLGADPARVVVHRLGVDLGAFSTRQDRAPGVPVVVMIGRFVEKKGMEYGIRAFARAAAGREASLVIVGDGDRRALYEEEARAAGVSARVRFAGSVPHAEVAQIVRDATVLLAPSIETASRDRDSGLLAVKEAAASGVPAIGTRHGGIPEIIDDGETGFLVPERDVDAMTQRLGMVLDDLALRDRLGAAARRKMEREYDLPARVEALEALYDRGLEGRRRA